MAATICKNFCGGRTGFRRDFACLFVVLGSVADGRADATDAGAPPAANRHNSTTPRCCDPSFPQPRNRPLGPFMFTRSTPTEPNPLEPLKPSPPQSSTTAPL